MAKAKAKPPAESKPAAAEKTKPTGLRLLRMKVENFMKIVIAEIAPNGESVAVWGENEQGKSSLLNAVWTAMGGKDVEPDVPVRRGAKEANIELTLGEINTPQLIIRYRRQADSKTEEGAIVRGKRYLELFKPDGAKFDAPQTQLDKLTNGKMFNPLSFMKLKPAEQAAVIGRIAGIDIVAHEQKARAIYDQRTEANRKAKEAAASLTAEESALSAAMQKAGIAEEPTARVEISEYMDKIAEINARNDTVRKAQADLKIVADGHLILEQKHKDAIDQVEKVKKTAEKAIADAVEQMNRAALTVENSKKAKARVEKEVGEMKLEPTAEFEEKVKSAEPINNAFRLVETVKAAKVKVAETAKTAELLDEKYKEINKDHLAAVAAAKLPIEGMGITSTGVTINGLPLEQQAASVRLRLSAEITAAENHECRVMILEDASLLDQNMRNVLHEVAAKRNVQLLLEYVSHCEDKNAIHIVEGQIAP